MTDATALPPATTTEIPTEIAADIAADAPLAEREREYSPSSCIGGDYRPFVAAYRSRSDEARLQAAARGGHWARHAYGPAPTQGIELCLPRDASVGAAASSRARAPAPLLLFVHGGYWQELGAVDSLFAATACIERGVAFAALDYTLAPAASVASIVDECRQALRWLGEHAPALGLAADQVVLAGSSAGAHLCASIGAATCGAPRGTLLQPRAVVLISGVYWLAPLIGTSIDHALGLDAGAAARASPGLSPLTGFAPSLVCWGEIETAAFKAQSRHFAARLRVNGMDCEELEVTGRNHFDIVFDLADARSALGRRVFDLLAPP